MSDATEVLTVQEGQAAVKQVAVSGEIISLPSATDVKAIVQTDKGPVAAIKTVSLGGGGGGGGSASGNFVEQLSTMPDASTKVGKIVQYVGTEAGAYNHGAFYESVAQSDGTYAWQETTVDKLLEEMVENNASVLTSSTSLNATKGTTKNITLTALTAYTSLDSRPSHKAPGAVVYDGDGRIGIIADITGASRAKVVTVYVPPAGLPSGAGAYKVLGTTSTPTPAWVDALVVRDVTADSLHAGSTYFGGKPFMSKTGAYETTKFQTYTVNKIEAEASYTMISDDSNGQIVITDPAALYAGIKTKWFDAYGGYGSITEIAPDQTIRLTFYVDDYHGPTMLQYNASLLIIDPVDPMSTYNGNSMYFTTSDLAEMGITSTLTAGGGYTLEIKVGNVGGSGYQYESQGCAKIQAANTSNPTYAFSMPGNMAQMGGVIDLPSMGPGVAVENNPVQLPRALANADYVVQLTVITESGFQQVVVDASHRTTTGFDVCARNNDTAATVTGAKVAWTVVGVMPMTLYSGLA